MNVLLIAQDAAGVRVLRAMDGLDHHVVAVMTLEESPAGRGVTVASLARSRGHPVWDATLASDRRFAVAVSRHDVDILINVHSLTIVDPAVLAAVPLGGFNLHPGPLPTYAGLDPVSWAIYRGERTHAVTIHRMEALVDAGPIAYEESFSIGPDDSALQVTTRCVDIGVRLILRLLETAATDASRVPARPQDPDQRRWFGRTVPQRGQLRWAEPAARIVDFVRACDYHPLVSRWGHPRARIGPREIGIVRATRTGDAARVAPGTVGERSGGSVRIAGGDEWISVDKVLADGRYTSATRAIGTATRLEDGLGGGR